MRGQPSWVGEVALARSWRAPLLAGHRSQKVPPPRTAPRVLCVCGCVGCGVVWRAFVVLLCLGAVRGGVLISLPRWSLGGPAARPRKRKRAVQPTCSWACLAFMPRNATPHRMHTHTRYHALRALAGEPVGRSRVTGVRRPQTHPSQTQAMRQLCVQPLALNDSSPPHPPHPQPTHNPQSESHNAVAYGTRARAAPGGGHGHAGRLLLRRHPGTGPGPQAEEQPQGGKWVGWWAGGWVGWCGLLLLLLCEKTTGRWGGGGMAG